MRDLHTYLWRTEAERNLAYLALRVFVGFAMLTHGWPKLMGGPDTWQDNGGIMGSIGIPGPAVFWGFMAAVAEGVGGILLIIGLFSPVASFLIAVTMIVAVFVFHRADPFGARELGLFFLFNSILFLFKGAGAYSIDRLLPQRHS